MPIEADGAHATGWLEGKVVSGKLAAGAAGCRKQVYYWISSVLFAENRNGLCSISRNGDSAHNKRKEG
ncbi:hypothetical protein RCO48_18195 [Peribacillus frigoritolerans]|nr:hypothetical protein [Peribacillus frigoritolerans]